MAGKILITGIGGSLEETSYSLSALKYILSEFSKLGADIQLVDIKFLDLPLYDYSGARIEHSGSLKDIMDLLSRSDGLIFSSPEYHGTISAVFKNFIDHLEYLSSYTPPYLTLKPVGCIAIGGGDNSGVFTLNSLINIVHSLRGITVSSNLAIANVKQAFDERGELKDENVKRRLKRLAGDIYLVAAKLSK
jgi:FMN reductase